MNTKIVLILLLAIICMACTNGSGQNEEGQYVTEIPVYEGDDIEASKRDENPPTAEPTGTVATITPTEAIVEDIITPTAVPSISPTPIIVVPEKKTLSERIIVKAQKNNVEEENILLYQVKHDGLYGVINQYGEVVVEPIYEYIGDFSEGYATVYQDKKLGYIDENGTLLTMIEFENAYSFSEGLAAVKVDGLYGFIDTTGQFVIEPQYKVAHYFSDGLAFVWREEKEHPEFITPDGAMAFEVHYGNCGSFHDGLAKVRLTHSSDYYTYGYMDKTGQVVISPITDGRTKDLPVADFSEGFAIMYLEKKDNSVVKVYVNTAGEILGGYEFQEAFDFSEGLAYAERDGICGYIDKTGEYVIMGASASWFLGGLASCRTEGKMGFIDKTGKYVIEPIYDICYYGFGHGYGVVSQGEELICINKLGEEMWRLLPEE